MTPIYVPVGDDQRQHVEVTRDIAQRVNSLRGEVFRLPQPLIRSTGARVMGLDDPTTKMSKTTARSKPSHAILLLDPPDTVSRKIARATTDTNPQVAEPLGPGVANLRRHPCRAARHHPPGGGGALLRHVVRQSQEGGRRRDQRDPGADPGRSTW